MEASCSLPASQPHLNKSHSTSSYLSLHTNHYVQVCRRSYPSNRSTIACRPNRSSSFISRSTLSCLFVLTRACLVFSICSDSSPPSPTLGPPPTRPRTLDLLLQTLVHPLPCSCSCSTSSRPLAHTSSPDAAMLRYPPEPSSHCERRYADPGGHRWTRRCVGHVPKPFQVDRRACREHRSREFIFVVPSCAALEYVQVDGMLTIL
jgi:hypothetical protein